MELKKVQYSELPNKGQIINFFYGVRNYLFPNYFDETINLDEMLNISKDMFKLYISKDETVLNKFYSELENAYKSLFPREYLQQRSGKAQKASSSQKGDPEDRFRNTADRLYGHSLESVF